MTTHPRNMLEHTIDDARAEHLKRMEAKMFAPGAYVMLHHDSKAYSKPHDDAGRIGRIVSCDDSKMVVEFWCDELVGSSTFSVIPRRHWAPMPDFCVEEYEPRAKKRGWRLSERGARVAAGMGWQITAATRGEA